MLLTIITSKKCVIRMCSNHPHESLVRFCRGGCLFLWLFLPQETCYSHVVEYPNLHICRHSSWLLCSCNPSLGRLRGSLKLHLQPGYYM